MGRLFVVNLEGQIYSCKYCGTHLALYDDIISKGKRLLRFKVSVPDESSYLASQEADGGGSDEDDV